MGKYWTNKTDNVDTVGAEIFIVLMIFLIYNCIIL